MSQAYETPISLTAAEAALNNHQDRRTKAGRSEYQRLKSELTKIYNQNKKFLSEFEKTNFEYLALLKSTHGFYKFIGHSALFYTYSIAPKLNLTAHLKPDGDFAHKSPEGIVSVRNPEKITEALQTLNIKQLKTKNRTGDFLLFKLPWTFTEQQLADMIDQQNSKLQSFNHIVMVDNIIPVLSLQLEELLKAVYENVRGMGSPVEREAFGHDLIKTVITMNHLYLDLTNGYLSRHACLIKLKTHLQQVKYQIKLIADLKIWTPKTSSRLAEITIKLSDIITRELKNIKPPKKGTN